MPTLLQKELPPNIEAMSRTIIGCAIEVHRCLGPGLLEKLYEDALAFELDAAGLPVRQQVEIAVPYKTTVLRSQKLDLMVGDLFVLELKAIQQLEDVHSAQLLSQLRAVDAPLGLLFNFNVTWLREGMHRVFNERWSKLPSVPQVVVRPPPSRPSSAPPSADSASSHSSSSCSSSPPSRPSRSTSCPANPSC